MLVNIFIDTCVGTLAGPFPTKSLTFSVLFLLSGGAFLSHKAGGTKIKVLAIISSS